VEKIFPGVWWDEAGRFNQSGEAKSHLWSWGRGGVRDPWPPSPPHRFQPPVKARSRASGRSGGNPSIPEKERKGKRRRPEGKAEPPQPGASARSPGLGRERRGTGLILPVRTRGGRGRGPHPGLKALGQNLAGGQHPGGFFPVIETEQAVVAAGFRRQEVEPAPAFRLPGRLRGHPRALPLFELRLCHPPPPHRAPPGVRPAGRVPQPRRQIITESMIRKNLRSVWTVVEILLRTIYLTPEDDRCGVRPHRRPAGPSETAPGAGFRPAGSLVAPAFRSGAPRTPPPAREWPSGDRLRPRAASPGR